MDRLFESGEEGSGGEEIAADAPLAARMRPRTLPELVGQEHLLGEGSALRVAIEAGNPHSAILYGPPGSGKTTLARVIAASADAAFEEVSAVNAGRAEVRAVLDRARERLAANGRATIFFLDEIHRFNKAQQDALLPAVETGLVTLIGATTENPFFEVNSALISRSQVYELESLGAGHLRSLLERALADPERGIADPPAFDDAALDLISERAGGDARSALAALERAVAITRGGAADRVDLEVAEQALQQRAVMYDREGDRHYDFTSAWIKATRGSDPDASLYYLAAMLAGGEDPRFIVRRMVVLASEDIGNADPLALLIATAAGQAVDRVGLPECELNLAQAAVYLALAPKSNASYKGLRAAQAHIRERGVATPPDYLRDAHYPGARKLGRGKGYVYPHDQPGGIADQPLLPEQVRGTRFYEPTDREYRGSPGATFEGPPDG